MDILNPFPQVSYALQKSVGLWLSVWAVRFSAGIDYKLSAQGKTIRWAVVVICFALTSVPGASLGWFRVSSYLIGLAFLCWPNLAYHLGKLFDEWPIAEGRVDSVQQQSDSRWTIAYDFEIGGERYGGHDTVKSGSIKRDASDERTRVLVRSDPLNPGRSSRIQGVKANCGPPN
jgi:hypothetical protein